MSNLICFDGLREALVTGRIDLSKADVRVRPYAELNETEMKLPRAVRGAKEVRIKTSLTTKRGTTKLGLPRKRKVIWKNSSKKPWMGAVFLDKRTRLPLFYVPVPGGVLQGDKLTLFLEKPLLLLA